MDEDNPTYFRAYAWLKLVTFWSALRGDDSTWITPSSIFFTKVSGMTASLYQSKTTGPGKKSRSREICISQLAFLMEEEWLETGLKLWRKADPNRQNFIVLPPDDNEAFTNLGAIPADRAALTRQILNIGGLKNNDADSHRIIRILASYFWSEHSARATLVSMARALHVPKTITDRLGWWGMGSDASDGYMRTYRTLISKVQEKVAATIRKSMVGPGKLDVFGENFVLADLTEKIKSKKPELKDEDIRAFIDTLRTFSKETTVLEDEASREWWLKETDKEDLAILGGEGAKEQDVKNDESSEDEEPEPQKTVPLPGTWVVTRKYKCLHIVGDCYREPLVHYIHFDTVKPKVDKDLFRVACGVCFPLGWPLSNRLVRSWWRKSSRKACQLKSP